jgi:DNA repair protein RAD50
LIPNHKGCGKTTIIEALKYSVTGSLPPGNKSGQSFVHDPKSIGQSVVKASIKLRFNNRGHQSMVVIRSMEVTQKKSTASFKALDGIIRTVNPDTGERVSLSHKCSELDRQIPALMGVSKPILEHVVFCHQEDSSWPLQEGAVLKKRFDDIFDSTRYAKALEAIKNSRKEYAATVKDLKADLEGLKSHKHAASGFIEELEDVKDQISGLDDEITRCTEGMEKERASIDEANKIIGEIEAFDVDMDMKAQEMEREEAVLQSQKDMLGQDDLTGRYSYEELKTMLRELSDKHHGNQAERELQEKEREVENIVRELERARRVANELNAKKGKLEAERDAYSVYVTVLFACVLVD